MENQELPNYKCHKEVKAIKIASVVSNFDNSFLIPEDTDFEPIGVNNDFMLKHKPESSGYFVVYEDGYKSWSPVKAFEEGYGLSELADKKISYSPTCYITGRKDNLNMYPIRDEEGNMIGWIFLSEELDRSMYDFSVSWKVAF